MDLSAAGVLERYGVELIGADVAAIRRAEDREVFRDTMAAAGLAVPESRVVTDMAAGRAAAAELGLPVILRPGFTLGGEGGGAAHTPEELERDARAGARREPDRPGAGRALGARVGRDRARGGARRRPTTRSIVCSIENIDPMGVHTGDSVTVAPVMTLTDPELQRLRDAAIAVIRAVGVSTGGANVQFALNRATGEMVVIEMNPRVSRSSALASKATGFPIAKIAARLAVGYTLDELPNEITGVTPASFEPTLDYVAVKVPRFAFEKLPGASTELTTHMKSVGEVLALGRTFGEAFGKAMAGRELDVRAPHAGRRWTRPSRCCAPPPGTATTSSSGRSAAGVGEDEIRAGHRHRPLVPAPSSAALAAARRGGRRPARGASTRDALRARAARGRGRPRHRRRPPARPSWRSGDRRRALGRAAHLPRGRHLRGRVRRRSRPTTTRPSRARASSPATTAPSIVVLGSGPEPHRPGDRVRLLLRPRRRDGRASWATRR